MLASTIQFGRSVPTDRTTPANRATCQGGRRSHRPVPLRCRATRPDSSGPNSVSLPARSTDVPGSTPAELAVLRGAGDRAGSSSTIPLVNTTSATRTDAGRAGCVLLRKEVIQPHLPVRLPCYDFVPIASPTFDGSLHKG